MRILVVNCGSATLKYSIRDGADPSERLRDEVLEVSEAEEGIRRMLAGFEGSVGDIDAIGVRVVHGGARYLDPHLVDEAVLDGIEEASAMAPLHNTPALEAIRALRASRPGVPVVAVFDTAFHATIPDAAALYAIPRELSDRHGIRRYGFHGLAHRYMAERYAALSGSRHARIVTLQLGGGCSAAAVRDGRCMDTSMGFTPLEGLMMSTRSGDLDPSLPGFLSSRGQTTLEQTMQVLQRRSGLLGVSAKSGSAGELLEAESNGDGSAALALAMFCYRAAKYVGAFAAVLRGIDALIFGGGVGENLPEVRARICDRLGHLGIELDEALNTQAEGREMLVSSGPTEVLVAAVDEASVIAADTLECLRRSGAA